MRRMSYQSLRLELREGIAIVTYLNPPVNFMSTRSLYELRRAFEELERDPRVRVILLTSECPGSFILHTDLRDVLVMLKRIPKLPNLGRWIAAWMMEAFISLSRRLSWALDLACEGSPGLMADLAYVNMRLLFDAVERSGKITVAAIDGACMGGGFELSLCFDLRVASDCESTWFAQPEILPGLQPGYGGTYRMAEIIGPLQALDFQLRGAAIDSLRAFQLGLVSEVLPKSGFRQKCLALAKDLASRPVQAAQALKRIHRAELLAKRRGQNRRELMEILLTGSRSETQLRFASYAALIDRELARPAEQRGSPSELFRQLTVESKPVACHDQTP